MAKSGLRSESATIGIVGASARAAIHSLARAGFEGWAIDLFADRDLKQLVPCATCPIASFPNALPSLIANFPLGPILYTGGLENHPNIIAQLAANRPLWGNLPVVLERVRDPHCISTILNANSTPKVIPPGAPAPKTGRWLRKPLRSSGGRGIRFAMPNEEAASSSHYFQEFIDGPSLSALFVSNGDAANGDSQTRLLGVTNQLIGRTWLHARPFAYCGNIGPVQFPAPIEAALCRSAQLLSHTTGLRGLWGLDFILNAFVPCIVEVNPRYTAAIEVLELTTKLQSLLLHHNCFTKAHSVQEAKNTRHITAQIIKAVYYAPHRIVFPIAGPWDNDLEAAFDPWRVPGFADIPEPRTVIEPGFPVLTLFAVGSSTAECLKELQSRAAELDCLFAEIT